MCGTGVVLSITSSGILALQGNTAIHYAAMAPTTSVLRLLLQRGALVDVAERSPGVHPIHVAANHHRLDNIRLLVEEAGIDPDLKIKGSGVSPLIHATGSVKSGRSNPEAVAVIQYLLGTGRVDVNAKDSKVRATALHYAAMDGALDVLEVLVAAGADLSAKNKSNKTAAQLAEVGGHTEAARYLVEQSEMRTWSFPALGAISPKIAAGSISTLAPGAGLTALQLAAKEGDLEVVKRLVEQAGMDPKDPDQTVSSALSDLWLAPRSLTLWPWAGVYAAALGLLEAPGPSRRVPSGPAPDRPAGQEQGRASRPDAGPARVRRGRGPRPGPAHPRAVPPQGTAGARHAWRRARYHELCSLP